VSTSMTNPKALFAFPSQEKPKASLLVLYIAGFERRLRRTYGAGHCIFDNDIICVRGLAGTDKGPQISRHGLCEVRRRLSGSRRPALIIQRHHNFATFAPLFCHFVVVYVLPLQILVSGFWEICAKFSYLRRHIHTRRDRRDGGYLEEVGVGGRRWEGDKATKKDRRYE